VISNLTPEEAQVLTVKYQSKPFSRMSPAEMEMAANTLLLKVHVITGWTIPADEIMLLFIDQFKKKAIESYSLVNPDEIEFAFRKYGVGVKDWGKSMNLSLIDEVMQPYLELRSEISRFEESKTNSMPIALPESKMTDDQMFEWIKEVGQKYQSGQYSYRMIPVFMYDFLNEKGLIKANKKEILDKAKKSRLNYWQNQLSFDPRDRVAKEAMEFLISDKIDRTHPEFNGMINEAKRICLINYFNETKKD